MMTLSEQGKAMIKNFEGLRLHAYRDVAGVWTIGYGSTKYSDGRPVHAGDILANETQASDLFTTTLLPYETAVNKRANVPLTQHQFDALVSFVYNVGTGVMLASTLVKKLNAGDYYGAADQLLAWDKITDPKTGDKVVCKTLALRRAQERDLFLR